MTKRTFDETDLDEELLHIRDNAAGVPAKRQRVPSPRTLDEFNEQFGDDYYGDSEDRNRLSKMKDVDREAILFERHELKLKLKRREELLRGKKNLAAPVEGHPAQRGRMDLQGALSDLGARRSKYAEKSSMDHSDEERDNLEQRAKMEHQVKIGGHQVKADNRKQQDEVPADHEVEDKPMTFAEAGKLLLKRNRLEEWANEPKFQQLVSGCFVRVFLGNDNDKRTYRVALVDGVECKARTYKFHKSSKISTNKYLRCRVGDSKKLFSMDKVSNDAVTHSEFQFWIHETKKSKQANIPTVKAIEALMENQQEILRNRSYFPNSIKSVVNRNANVVYELRAVEDEVRALFAEQGNVDDIVASWNSIIEQELQAPLSLQNEHEESQHQASNSSSSFEDRADSLLKRFKSLHREKAELNRLEKVLQGEAKIDFASAIIMKNQKSDEEKLKMAGILHKKSSDLDPFARRVTQSKGLQFFGKAVTPKDDKEDSKEQQQTTPVPLPPPSPAKSPGIALHDTFNFEVDIPDFEGAATMSADQPLQSNSNRVVAPSSSLSTITVPPLQKVATASEGNSKKGLSISDYKKMKQSF